MEGQIKIYKNTPNVSKLVEFLEKVFQRKILLFKYLRKPYFTNDATVFGYK